MTNELHTPLTNAQLDLLKMFSRDVDDRDWIEVKSLITKYFAQKAIEEADKVWDEQGWNEQTMIDLANTHMRTPYRSKEDVESAAIQTDWAGESVLSKDWLTETENQAWQHL